MNNEPGTTTSCHYGFQNMGKKGGKKTKASGLDALGDMASELFKTLPPIKRAELNKVVENSHSHNK